MSLLVMGPVNRDVTVRMTHFPRPGETLLASSLQTAVGGKSANQAVAGALVGASSHLIARRGADLDGVDVLQSLRDSGVDVESVLVGEAPTGTALISVRGDGENTVVVAPGANQELKPQDLPPELLARGTWALFSLEVPWQTVWDAAARARAAGVKVALNASPLSKETVDLTSVDLVIVNDGEAEHLLGYKPDLLDKPTEELGVETVVVTHGSDGATIHRRGEGSLKIPGVAVETIDTTGCGDAFAGVLIGRLTLGDTLEQAGRTAALFAAIAATRLGAQVSYPRDFAV